MLELWLSFALQLVLGPVLKLVLELGLGLELVQELVQEVAQGLELVGELGLEVVQLRKNSFGHADLREFSLRNMRISHAPKFSLDQC